MSASSPRYNHVLEGERVRRRGSLLKRMSTKFLKRNAAATDYRWSSIVLGIIESPPFQMRSTGP